MLLSEDMEVVARKRSACLLQLTSQTRLHMFLPTLSPPPHQRRGSWLLWTLSPAPNSSPKLWAPDKCYIMGSSAFSSPATTSAGQPLSPISARGNSVHFSSYLPISHHCGFRPGLVQAQLAFGRTHLKAEENQGSRVGEPDYCRGKRKFPFTMEFNAIPGNYFEPWEQLMGMEPLAG